MFLMPCRLEVLGGGVGVPLAGHRMLGWNYHSLSIYEEFVIEIKVVLNHTAVTPMCPPATQLMVSTAMRHLKTQRGTFGENHFIPTTAAPGLRWSLPGT